MSTAPSGCITISIKRTQLALRCRPLCALYVFAHAHTHTHVCGREEKKTKVGAKSAIVQCIVWMKRMCGRAAVTYRWGQICKKKNKTHPHSPFFFFLIHPRRQPVKWWPHLPTCTCVQAHMRVNNTRGTGANAKKEASKMQITAILQVGMNGWIYRQQEALTRMKTPPAPPFFLFNSQDQHHQCNSAILLSIEEALCEV